MKFFDLLHPSRATVPSGIKKALTVAVVSALLTLGAYVPVPAREQPKTVVLGGQPFGIKFFSDGVMVVDPDNSYKLTCDKCGHIKE